MISNNFTSVNKSGLTTPFSGARQYILSRLLIGLYVLSFMGLVPTLATLQIDNPRPRSLVVLSSIILALIALSASVINKQWPYQLRASLVLIILYVYGTQITFVDKLIIGIGHLILIAFVISAFTLLNTRIGVVASVLATITIGVVSYFSQGVDNGEIVAFYTTMPGLTLPIITFFIVAVAMILSISRLLTGIEATMKQELDLAQTLETEGYLLEERIVARQEALLLGAKVNYALTQLLDEAEIVQTAVQQISETFHIPNVQLYKFDPQEGDLKLRGAAGAEAQTLLTQEISLTIGFGPIGKAAVSQEVVTVVKPDHSQPHILSTTEIMLAIPISYEQSIYGILLVQHHDSASLNEDVNYAFKLIAEQIAIALRNAQLYGRAQKLLLHEALVNDIRSKIQSATSIEEVLQTAATELSHALDAPQTYVKIGRK